MPDPDVPSLWRALLDQQALLGQNQQAIIALQAQQKDHQRTEQEHQERVTDALEKLFEKQQAMSDILEQAKGGWRMLLAIGGMAAAVAGGFAWLYVNVFHGKAPSP